MEIKGIKYIGPILDNSGYGKAARGNIIAIHKLGVPITVNQISFETIRPDLGKEGKIINNLLNKEIDYNVIIMHSTPEFWHKFQEPDKIQIGYTIWETSLLHPDWKDYIDKYAHKVLVGCNWNVEVFRNSGVTIPIGVIPHIIHQEQFENVTPYLINGVNDDTFVFYDIFQWTERKNPLALIKAYWHEFKEKDNVALVLKTYRGNYSESEKNAIRTTITRLKSITPSDYYPPIYLISNMLSENEIMGLHKRGDCFVSLNRGEGFGLSPFTAGAVANPVIVTGCGGVREYAKEDNSYLVNYVFTPVFGMPYSPWYRIDQLWGEADVKHAANLMRYVYENQNEAKDRGKKLQKYIFENFSWEKIGQKIIDEIKNYSYA